MNNNEPLLLSRTFGVANCQLERPPTRTWILVIIQFLTVDPLFITGMGWDMVCAGTSDRFNSFRWRELARHESAKDVPTELAKKDRDKHF